MKTLTTTLLVLSISTAALMTATIYAAEKEHGHKGVSSSESQSEHDHMQKMNEHMETMQAQMQAIRAEKDLDKRKELMQAHRKSIREGMEMMMQDESGKGMMGKTKGEIHEGMKGEEEMEAHARMGNMEEHLDMMQQMMEQMMQHQNEYYELNEAYRDLDRDLGS